MVFSGSIFLFYFLPLFLFVYFIPKKSSYKNLIILIFSILFYAWGASDFILIVVGSIFIDFYLVKYIHLASSLKTKQLLLSLSIIMNIGLLAYFKYANFFVENINILLSTYNIPLIRWTSVALPIGISFFTFQKMTYGIDVYRKVYHPLQKWTDFALYILMFPQLIAGPIVRFNEIASQIEDRKENENLNNRITGFFRFSIGLAKKVLIANTLGEQADFVFALPADSLHSFQAWIGILAYTFQIYYDFSGYSDMAIGIGRMIGFDFPENFDNPYISRSITEFWKRWHITLGRWMKDYLYIPLGGNRVSTIRLYFNLWLVFLISGLWHGAAWTFIAWGAFHGLFLIADRIYLLNFYKIIGKYPSILITFIITIFGWVIFRAENMKQALLFFKKLLSTDFQTDFSLFESPFYTTLIVAAIFGFWAMFGNIEKWQQQMYAKQQNVKVLIAMFSFSVLLSYISVSYIISSGFNPFIYFRF